MAYYWWLYIGIGALLAVAIPVYRAWAAPRRAVDAFIRRAQERMSPDDNYVCEAAYVEIAVSGWESAGGEDADSDMLEWIGRFRERGIPIEKRAGIYVIPDDRLDEADALWIQHFGCRYGGNLLVRKNDRGEWVAAAGAKGGA